MLFYDKEEKIQVRLKVECIVNHENDITKQSWLKTGHMSRKCYLVDNGPGTKSETPTSGLKPELDNFEFTMEQSEVGYKNFTVIQCKIKRPIIQFLPIFVLLRIVLPIPIKVSSSTWHP